MNIFAPLDRNAPMAQGRYETFCLSSSGPQVAVPFEFSILPACYGVILLLILSCYF